MNIVLEINNVAMPYDHMTSYECGIRDIDADTSGRNDLTGDMHRDRVAVKRTISFTLAYVSVVQMSSILNLIKDPNFTVRYFDVQDADIKTGVFNCGDRVPKFSPGNDNLYEAFTIDLTEV